MATKTITIKNLMEEINKLGFNEEDQREPKASVREVNRFSDKNKFRDFASSIWKEAKKDNLTPKDIDEIIHQVRFVRSSSDDSIVD